MFLGLMQIFAHCKYFLHFYKYGLPHSNQTGISESLVCVIVCVFIGASVQCWGWRELTLLIIFVYVTDNYSCV